MTELVSLQSSKKTVNLLTQAKPGDMIEFKRGTYSHWAVYIGEGLIIHRWGEDDGIGQSIGFWGNITTFSGVKFDKATILQSTIEDLLYPGGKIVQVNNYLDGKWKPLPADDIVDRARATIGSQGYNLIYGNCEHFATECRYGSPNSRQVQVGVAATALTSVALVIATGFAAYAIAKIFPSPIPQDEDDDDEEKTRKIPIKR